jgi:hypothetical protein
MQLQARPARPLLKDILSCMPYGWHTHSSPSRAVGTPTHPPTPLSCLMQIWLYNVSSHVVIPSLSQQHPVSRSTSACCSAGRPVNADFSPARVLSLVRVSVVIRPLRLGTLLVALLLVMGAQFQLQLLVHRPHPRPRYLYRHWGGWCI